MPATDLERLRLAVFEEWDPIGVYHFDDDSADRRTYWDEYDAYLPEIARRLEQGDEDGLVSYLAHVRTNLIGLSPAPQLDAAAVRNLVRRHSQSI
jgi:hypothetical protein